MAGFPQLREAGWLYGDDPYLPLALVRLFERMDGTGWEVWLDVNHPREGEKPLTVVEHPDEESARAELARLYSTGEWRIRQPDAL
ncbi:hypothetical protein ACIBEF_00450 [Micromonospora sp. NPDC050795]|uniref:hypothetical protein n=1 Tax=Micromonospora sp. NPDC050795 TaxID=3364282 RepID=UPI0037947824